MAITYSQAVLDAKEARRKKAAPETVTLKGASQGGVAVQPDTVVKADTPTPLIKPVANAGKTATGAPINQQTEAPSYEVQKTTATPNSVQTSETVVTPEKAAYVMEDGKFDPNYLAKSEDEIFNAPIDEYTRQNWLRNYYGEQGLEFDPKATPGSFQDEAKIFLEGQDKAKSELERQVNFAKTQASNQLEEGKSANVVGLGQSREGAVSQGNQMTRDDIDFAMESRYNNDLANLKAQMDSLNEQLTAGQGEFLRGREDQVRAQMASVAQQMASLEEAEVKKQEKAMEVLKLLSDNGALANLDAGTIKYLEDAMPGAPPGVVSLLADAATRKYGDEQTAAQFERQKDGLAMFKEMAASGVQASTATIEQTAAMTGLDPWTLYQYNTEAQRVMADKTLDTETKNATLQKLGLELDRQARGITNSTLETQDYFQKQVLAINSNGSLSASQKQNQIANLAMNLGLEDSRNPLTQTKKALDQTTIDMNNRKLNNQPLGAEEAANYGKVWNDGVNYGLEPSAIIPAGGAYGIVNGDDGLRIEVMNGQSLDNPNTSRDEGQCGAFVNDCFGERIVGNTFEQKMSLTDPSVTMPTAGMAFVMETETAYGHIGMIEKVNYEKGTMDIVDANWNLDGKIQRRTIPISTASGFIRPPNGQPVNKGASQQVSGMTDAQILEAYDKAGKIFTTPAEATKAVNTARQTGYVPGSTASTKAPTETEKTTAIYANRLREANDIFESIAGTIEASDAIEMAYQRAAPNFLKKPIFQQQEQAERNFINAVLRKESGASISPTEFESATKQYFPEAGDSKEVLAQKKQNRKTALEGLINASGNAYSQDPADVSDDDLYNNLSNTPTDEDLNLWNNLQ